MSFAVQLTDDVAHDLEEIFDYLSRQDAPGRAAHVLEQIEQAFQALSALGVCAAERFWDLVVVQCSRPVPQEGQTVGTAVGF